MKVPLVFRFAVQLQRYLLSHKNKQVNKQTKNVLIMLKIIIKIFYVLLCILFIYLFFSVSCVATTMIECILSAVVF